MTMLTVMGKNAHTATPFAKGVDSTFISMSTRDMAQMLTGSSPKLNNCTKKLNL